MNRRALAIGAIALAAGAAGCMSDIDPPWQLDHDRIVAVRAEPPGIMPGQHATIEALLARKGEMTAVAPPELARVVSPASLSDVLSIQGGAWVVTAPDESRLAAARAELQLAAGAPVPLQIGVSYTAPDQPPDQPLIATKVITLGQAAANPAIDGLAIDGKDPGSAELVVGKLVKVPLSVNADDTDFDVTWLTSCGTMHDFDLPQAYLKVETDDPDSGELAVVVRDARGGVSWRLWSIRAE